MIYEIATRILPKIFLLLMPVCQHRRHIGHWLIHLSPFKMPQLVEETTCSDSHNTLNVLCAFRSFLFERWYVVTPICTSEETDSEPKALLKSSRSLCWSLPGLPSPSAPSLHSEPLLVQTLPVVLGEGKTRGWERKRKAGRCRGRLFL